MVSVHTAFDSAIPNIQCREPECGLAEMFGGISQSVQTDMTTTIVSPKEAHQRATAAVDQGFEELKFKTGGSVGADSKYINHVHRAAPTAAIKIDASQDLTV
jgi:hypothetical protein